MIKGRKDLTLNEMVGRLLAEQSLRISLSALNAWLRGHGWTFKKSAHALEQVRPDILKRRRTWFEGQLDLDPAKLVFIDETGLSTKMARLRAVRHAASAAAPVCRMAIGKPRLHRHAAADGMTAPFVYDGAMNGNVFLA